MQKTLTRAGLAALALTGIAFLLTVPGLAEEAATPPAPHRRPTSTRATPPG